MVAKLADYMLGGLHAGRCRSNAPRYRAYGTAQARLATEADGREAHGAPRLDIVAAADVVVVGSGAGGAVAASVLARSGLSVIVLEAGDYIPADSIADDDGPALGSYDCGNTMFTDDAGAIAPFVCCLHMCAIVT